MYFCKIILVTELEYRCVRTLSKENMKRWEMFVGSTNNVWRKRIIRSKIAWKYNSASWYARVDKILCVCVCMCFSKTYFHSEHIKLCVDENNHNNTHKWHKWIKKIPILSSYKAILAWKNAHTWLPDIFCSLCLFAGCGYAWYFPYNTYLDHYHKCSVISILCVAFRLKLRRTI